MAIDTTGNICLAGGGMLEGMFTRNAVQPKPTDAAKAPKHPPTLRAS